MSLSIRQWLAVRQIELDQLGRPDAQFAGIAFRIVQDMEIKSLTPFDISVLAEILELPLRPAGKIAQAFSHLSVWLLRLLSRKKPLKRNEGTWLSFQIAYLNALQRILEQEYQLKRPWINRAEFAFGAEVDHLAIGQKYQSSLHALPLNDPALQALLKTLRPGRLSDSQAEQALNSLAESLFVQQMNNTAIAWFIANGAEETEAKLLTQRLANGLPGFLLPVIAENALPLAQLQKFVRLGNLAAWRDNPSAISSQQNTPDLVKYQQSDNGGQSDLIQNFPVNLHREQYRAKLLQDLSEPLLTEHFSLKDLYIPLKGKEEDETALEPNPPVDLMEWAIAQLQEQRTIAIIEADSGFGKTSFCQIFAVKVAQELYPSWMPVLIRLRDATLGQTLEETLESVFPWGCFTSSDSWLASPLHPPCLLILDGLDEMLRSPQVKQHLGTFFDQLIKFQGQQFAATENAPRHKIFLTCSSQNGESVIDLLKTRYSLMSMLRRIRILPLEQEEFREWFKQWAKLQSKSIAQAYFSFLKQGGVFRPRSPRQNVATLAHQPLMLYLLGILHRDGLIEENIFHISQEKFEIFDRICRWLLGENPVGRDFRPDLAREGLAHACRSPETIDNILQGQTPQKLRHVMQVAALNILRGIPETEEQRSRRGEDLGLRLSAFFFKIANPKSSKIDFSHSSFGEYLCAEEIAAQLKSLTLKVPDRYGEFTFAINSPLNVAQHLYQLISYGVLSTQIEEFVLERLRREEAYNASVFRLNTLFERLYSFYLAYCQGRWLDEGIVQKVHSQMQANSNPLNILQMDAAVGLNVFLLLCAIAKEAKIPFYPCGKPEILSEFDPDRLLTFIGRTAILSPQIFWQRCRHSLSQLQLIGASLNYARLAETNLWKANLSEAELINTNLVNANLQEVNFSRANLSNAFLQGANLSAAKLQGANFSGANLLGVNLTLANLANTCLFETQLDAENKNLAVSNGAIFSLEEFQIYCQSLNKENPEAIARINLSEEKTTIYLIESAEGEPVLPEDFDNSNDEESTLLADQYFLIEHSGSNNEETDLLPD